MRSIWAAFLDRGKVHTIDALSNVPDRSLLVVEDDSVFRDRLGRTLETLGFSVKTSESIGSAMRIIEGSAPAFAVVDVRLEDGSGLEVISALKKIRPDVRAIALTGYGNIPNAIFAVQKGAHDYLSKPCTADEIFVALVDTERDGSLLPNNIMTADRVQWEHIQRTYEMCGKNISATARRLNMHRRTLQRILAKRAPR